jgi:ubiquinone/menaquinone biosynthesis C-methylase UbiE
MGCGTGSLTVVIHEKSPTTSILAVDIAPGMLEEVNKLRLPNVSTQQEDGTTLAGLEDASFTHAVTSFAIMFIPDPRRKLGPTNSVYLITYVTTER